MKTAAFKMLFRDAYELRAKELKKDMDAIEQSNRATRALFDEASALLSETRELLASHNFAVQTTDLPSEASPRGKLSFIDTEESKEVAAIEFLNDRIYLHSNLSKSSPVTHANIESALSSLARTLAEYSAIKRASS
jgi:hypothetical protein